jgi:hypothetical protein
MTSVGAAGAAVARPIHLASARALGSSVRQIVTYDEWMADAVKSAGWTVDAPQ